MSHDLNLSEEDIRAAYRHWERRGLVRRVSDEPPVYQYVSVYQQFLMRDAAPRDTAYEDFAESLYALFGKDRQLHGRETTMAYEWVEDMGLPQEVVLMLVNYMITNHGKDFSFATAQKKAVELAKEKVSTIEEAEEILGREKKIERRAQAAASPLWTPAPGQRRRAQHVYQMGKGMGLIPPKPLRPPAWRPLTGNRP